MSMHVKGFKAHDEKWLKMKAVYESCVEAKIPVPPEVCRFFNWDTPDDAGVTVEIKGTEACKPFKDDMMSGFDIDLKKLPADLTHVRFYCSY